MSDLTYSWASHPGAVEYLVEIEHQTTHEQDSQTTSNTTVTFREKPSGTYDIVVKAKFADGSTQIIITDEVTH